MAGTICRCEHYWKLLAPVEEFSAETALSCSQCYRHGVRNHGHLANHSITLHYKNLYRSLPTRMLKIIRSKGYIAKYWGESFIFFLMLWNLEVHVKFTCCTTSAIFVYNNMITCCIRFVLLDWFIYITSSSLLSIVLNSPTF